MTGKANLEILSISAPMSFGGKREDFVCVSGLCLNNENLLKPVVVSYVRLVSTLLTSSVDCKMKKQQHDTDILFLTGKKETDKKSIFFLSKLQQLCL